MDEEKVDFMNYGGIFRRRKDSGRYRAAYIKVSSYLLNTEHVNIAKIQSPKQMKQLIKKCMSNPDFMVGQPETKRYYIRLLIEFLNYVKDVSPTIRVLKNGKLETMYLAESEY